MMELQGPLQSSFDLEKAYDLAKAGRTWQGGRCLEFFSYIPRKGLYVLYNCYSTLLLVLLFGALDLLVVQGGSAGPVFKEGILAHGWKCYIGIIPTRFYQHFAVRAIRAGIRPNTSSCCSSFIHGAQIRRGIRLNRLMRHSIQNDSSSQFTHKTGTTWQSKL